MTSLYSQLARKRYEEERKKNEESLEKNNMIKLSEWLDAKKSAEPMIFVDQDETLLHIGYEHEMKKNKNAKFVECSGNTIGVVVRPHAYTFLKECKNIGQVYVLTAGITNFQKKILEGVNLLNLVDGVYGLDKFHEVPQGGKGILIDNLPHHHPNSSAKLEAMGGGMFLRVPDWYGENASDDVLAKVLSEIKRVYSPSSCPSLPKQLQ